MTIRSSVNLYEKEKLLLSDFMKQNKIKSETDFVRKCIELAFKLDSRNDLSLNISNKLNRIIYRESIQKNH